MKKMRGIIDPITLGFVIVALGAGLAASKTANVKEQGHVAKTQVQAPHVVAKK